MLQEATSEIQRATQELQSDTKDKSPAQKDEPQVEYSVIARRYRPQTFDDLVGQEHVARALQQAIVTDRVGHAYLFTGARGVGKTSAARILAKALNCVHGPTPTPCNQCDICRSVSVGDDIDVLEIDGASNNTVDEVRDLRQNVAVRPSRTRYKVYIIDEVHMLSKSAFNALLKTLEEPPEHVKFIFATTEPHKIPITILSRCQRFDFAGISAGAIQSRLGQIAAAEGVAVEPAALQILASRASGSMRDSQSLLEQLLALGRGTITADDVNQLLGIAPAERLSGLVRHLVARDASAALAELDATIHSGVEVGLLLDQLVGYFRDVMTTAAGCPASQMLYALPSQADEVAGVGRQLGLSTVLAIGQILDHTAARLRTSIHARTLVEMAVVRICQLGELDDLAALVAELRGVASEQTARVAENRPSSTSPATRSTPQTAAKKNDEPSVGSSESTAAANTERTIQRHDVGHAIERPTTPVDEAEEDASSPESVLAQWKRALANGEQLNSDATPPRLSRREQLAQIAEQPFVRRAMELFDVAPGQFRYTPPEGDQNP
ncbi:MAG TPA: DNA polymerase III subunit gamma/tau [Lacipirellulaceae bacterium]|nr:DNA polymerase III subunit gamma/tau [Lacipirellulaceae bacterium]